MRLAVFSDLYLPSAIPFSKLLLIQVRGNACEKKKLSCRTDYSHSKLLPAPLVVFMLFVCCEKNNSKTDGWIFMKFGE